MTSWKALFVTAAMLLLAITVWDGPRVEAQDPSVPIDASEIREVMDAQPEIQPPPTSQPSGIDLLTLIMRGGAFMIPIGLMSLMVVALVAERLMSLRMRKVVPPLLAEDMDELTHPIHRFDPTAAHQSCLDQPSPAANVIDAMLMRTGQPLADIERAASETIEREADRCAAPIRWLTLAAAATPLMGLLGTVWGMIVAFHESTALTPDRSRSEQLSEGIYTALVTTLAGLVVAIPAAIMALYLENRLANLFHRVEELAFEIAPGLARFEGRRRMDTDGQLHSIEGQGAAKTDVPKPPPPPRPAKKKRGGAKAG